MIIAMIVLAALVYAGGGAGAMAFAESTTPENRSSIWVVTVFWPVFFIAAVVYLTMLKANS